MFEILFYYQYIILIVAGLIGLIYGINKLRKKKKEESDLLKYVALATSIIIGVLNVLYVFEWKILGTSGVEIHWLTILLIFIAGSTMLAEPLKDTPLAAIIAIIAFGALSGLFLLVADFNEGFTNPVLLGTIQVPLWLVILGIVAIVLIVFLLTFLTEFTVDRILELVSWSPVVILFSALLLIQGVLIVLLGIGGIWEIFFPTP